MLHNKRGFHAELCSLLNGEGFGLESFDGARGSQVDGDVGTAFDFQSERLDDTAPLVLRVDMDGGRTADTEGCLPTIE